MFEIILKSVFEVYWPTQAGPNVQIFSRFKDAWDKINKSRYIAGIEDDVVAGCLTDKINEILAFISTFSQV